jgi:hypothetical protein
MILPTIQDTKPGRTVYCITGDTFTGTADSYQGMLSWGDLAQVTKGTAIPNITTVLQTGQPIREKTSETDILSGEDRFAIRPHLLYFAGHGGAVDLPDFVLSGNFVVNWMRQYQNTHLISFNRNLESLKAISNWTSEEFTKRTLPIQQQHESAGHLYHDIVNLFCSAAHEGFENGMEGELRAALNAKLQEHGIQTIRAIIRIILDGQMKPSVITEVLQWLGIVNHPESYEMRLWLLEKQLKNPSRWIRDGAALGLLSMKSPNAIPYLRDAIAQENIADLREDMEDILHRLERLL